MKVSLIGFGIYLVAISMAPVATAEDLKGLSPRARQIEQDAALMGRVQLACVDESKADSTDCKALREWQRAMFKDLQDDYRRRRPQAKEECAAGNEQACLVAACPPSMNAESAEFVRGCSRYHKLPSAAQWAQVEDAMVVCLASKVWVREYGEVFPFIEVRGGPRAGRAKDPYVAYVRDQKLRGQQFATLAEAASAGCTEVYKPAPAPQAR